MINVIELKNRITLHKYTKAAKAIKSELAEKFPGISFSIKSKSFASGDNVTIDWTGGPTSDAVESVVIKYRYGTFDASKNLYLYDSRDDAIPQAQYVMVSHHHSDSSQKKAKQEIADGFNVDMNDSQAVFAAFGNWPQPLIRAKLEHRSPFN